MTADWYRSISVDRTPDLFIQGVTFEPKPVFDDARGEVRQFVTAGANGRIGEVYFSSVWPGVIKATTCTSG